MRLDRVLTMMAEKAASDVYLSANAPILLKVNGQMQAITDHALAPGDPRSMLAEVLTPMQMEELEQQGELNIGLGIAKALAEAGATVCPACRIGNSGHGVSLISSTRSQGPDMVPIAS